MARKKIVKAEKSDEGGPKTNKSEIIRQTIAENETLGNTEICKLLDEKYPALKTWSPSAVATIRGKLGKSDFTKQAKQLKEIMGNDGFRKWIDSL